MLAWELVVDAQALRSQGWTVSAIARHLGVTRLTVRRYLSGEQTPGVRARSAPDPFAEYVEYCRLRLAADPHLWATTLFDELPQRLIDVGGSSRNLRAQRGVTGDCPSGSSNSDAQNTAGPYVRTVGTVSWPEGIEARSIDTGDADAWAELLAAKEKIDQEGENYSPQDLIDQLNDPHMDAALDTIGLWAEGRMAAYGKVHAADSVVDVDRVRTEGTVHPEWRRRGLGTALMPWLIQRAAKLHADKHPDAPGEVSNSTISTNVGADRLLKRFGFEECRYFFDMKRSLHQAVPEVPLADGLRLVPFNTSMDEALRVTHNEVFLDHWGSTPEDEKSWQTWFTGARAFRGGSSYLVLDGETIAAYVLCYEWEADTEATGIKELYVGDLGTRRSQRGRGLARVALTKVLTEAAQAGYQRAGLGVDADNPTGALGLYDSLGFSVHSKWVTYRLPL